MGDYSAEWETEQRRRFAAHVNGVAVRLRSVADMWVTLDLDLRPGNKGPDPDALVHFAPAGSRVPLRVDVVDVRLDMAEFVRGTLPRVRQSAGLAGSILAGAGDVRPGLLLMARVLPLVYDRDRDLGDEIARGAWDLDRRAAWAVGERVRPFALVEPCESCGLAALWVVPERLLIVCGNPACGASRGVTPPAAPVHSSGPDSVRMGKDSKRSGA